MSAKPHPRQFEPADELLRCDVVPERGRVRICPVGALDMANASVLEHELAELRAAGFRQLIVDLRGLRFMDSTGLRLVLRWHAAAAADGFELGVVPGAPAIQRVFELTGTLDRVPFVDSG
jgi:anti-sigma B factor antagonist